MRGRYLYKGFDPTGNQSEYGTPQSSLQGMGLRCTRVVGYPTVLPFKYMQYKNVTGIVNVGTYVFVSPYWERRNFGGQVPLKTQPAYQRPQPWDRKAPT